MGLLGKLIGADDGFTLPLHLEKFIKDLGPNFEIEVSEAIDPVFQQPGQPRWQAGNRVAVLHKPDRTESERIDSREQDMRTLDRAMWNIGYQVGSQERKSAITVRRIDVDGTAWNAEGETLAVKANGEVGTPAEDVSLKVDYLRAEPTAKAPEGWYSKRHDVKRETAFFEASFRFGKKFLLTVRAGATSLATMATRCASMALLRQESRPKASPLALADHLSGLQEPWAFIGSTADGLRRMAAPRGSDRAVSGVARAMDVIRIAVPPQSIASVIGKLKEIEVANSDSEIDVSEFASGAKFETSVGRVQIETMSSEVFSLMPIESMGSRTKLPVGLGSGALDITDSSVEAISLDRAADAARKREREELEAQGIVITPHTPINSGPQSLERKGLERGGPSLN